MPSSVSLSDAAGKAGLILISSWPLALLTPTWTGAWSTAAQWAPISLWAILFSLARSWQSFTDKIVPQPYLDEVFHIPQAQSYCRGNYSHWDDKITTPPGLYAASLLYHWLWKLGNCTTSSLRGFNALALVQLFAIAIVCRVRLEARLAERDGQRKGSHLSIYALHTAFNIGLFPALFFFTGLYYTDVVSTAAVLAAYQIHLTRLAPEGKGLFTDLMTLALGVGTLFMRQTNVFWVVVFMGGLEAVHAVRTLRPAPVTAPYHTTLVDVVRFYAWRYSVGDVHDPPLNLAWADDWVLCALSFGLAAICNPIRIIKQIWPHLSVLGLFAGFVVWNGGVVLGDKSNHIATIHLPQMLYIWPFFAFFSAPLLFPQLAVFILERLVNMVNLQRSSPAAPAPSNTASPAERPLEKAPRGSKAKNAPIKSGGGSSKPPRSPLLVYVEDFMINKHIWTILVYLPLTLLISLLIVRYNTIIHPFTLADNRHYMFYIFRYTIRRPGLIRYGLVVAYTVSRWFVWSRLAGCSPAALGTPNNECAAEQQKKKGVPFISTPFPSQELRAHKYDSGNPDSQQPQDEKPKAEPGLIGLETLDNPDSSSASPPSTSTALLWLLATTLSLITAPLVEPRYFILPWVFWRLLLPAWPMHACTVPTNGAARLSDIPGVGWLMRLGQKYDLRLVLETLWFMAINVGTMYMFLYRPFYWKDDAGNLLDGGRLQRFMW